MTITISTDCDCIKFTFGVPLEDVFPGGDLHPSLRNLLEEIYEAVDATRLPIKSILKHEEPIPDSLFLEETLTLCKSIDYMSAGTLMWMLRHFLASLPISLFPSYTNGKNYKWLRLAESCRSSLQSYVKHYRSNDYLIDRLADELLDLPAVNLLLIGYMLNFLRSIIFAEKNRFNRTTATILVNYFSNSIFVRPYKLRIEPKRNELQYHPLMLYLLIKWPLIQSRCIQKQPQCFVPQSKREVVVQKNFENNSTQTGLHKLDTIQEVSIDTVSSIVSSDSFVSLPDLNLSKDNGCQTEAQYNYVFYRPEVKSNTYFRNTVATQTVSDESVKSCEFIDDDYDDFVFVEFNSVQSRVSEIDDRLSSNGKLYSTSNGSCRKIGSELEVKSSKIGWTYTPTNVRLDVYKICCEDEGSKINEFDEKIGRGSKICSGDHGEDVGRVREVEDIGVNEGANATCDELIIKYPKIGRTYIPSKKYYDTNCTFERALNFPKDSTTAINEENKIQSEHSLTTKCSKIGWTYTPSKAYLGNKSDSSSGLVGLPSSSNVNNDFSDDGNTQTPLNGNKSRKSLINFGKIKSRIDVMKLFKDRKVSDAVSADDIGTKVKYKKMGSVRSTLF